MLEAKLAHGVARIARLALGIHRALPTEIVHTKGTIGMTFAIEVVSTFITSAIRKTAE